MAGPFKMKGNPMQRNFGIGSPVQKKEKTANELVEERTKLRENQSKLDERKAEGKKTFLGNYRRKRNLKKQEKNQQLINTNEEALSWRNNSEKKIPVKPPESMRKVGDKVDKGTQPAVGYYDENGEFQHGMKP